MLALRVKCRRCFDHPRLTYTDNTHTVAGMLNIHAHTHMCACTHTHTYMYALIFVTRLVSDSMRIALSLLEILLVHATKCGLAILHNDHATRWIG